MEQYILDFSGCVISVSHDRAFLDRTCTELIVMPDARRFEGTYSDYHEMQIQAKADAPKPTQNSQNPRQVREKENRKKGLSFREQKEFEKLTEDIETLETQKKELEDFFSSGTPDADGSKQKEYKRITDELSASYQRWEILAELAE